MEGLHFIKLKSLRLFLQDIKLIHAKGEAENYLSKFHEETQDATQM